jgi:lysozyme
MHLRHWLALSASALFLALTFALSLDHGCIHLNHPSRAEFPLWGLDVSHHQGPIDWPRVSATGEYDFVWIKATEGGDWTDPRFAENWRGARQAGLAVGGYHYFTLCRAPEEQAAHFLATLPPWSPGDLPPAVDLEHDGNCRKGRPAPEQIRAQIQEFLARVEQGAGVVPAIYTTREFHAAHLQGGLGDRPLWLRDVFLRPEGLDDRAWDFWQFRSRGRVAGIEGFVDLNVWRGDERGFRELTRTGSLPPRE